MIYILCGLTLAILIISYVVYRIAFYSPNKTQNDDHHLMDTEQMRPLYDTIHAMVDRMNAVPYERVVIPSRDGLHLAARYYHQKDGAPLDILMHGYRGTPSRDFSGGAMICLEEGHNLLMIEERAHKSSEGHTITFGIKERYDCLDWVQYAIDRFGPDVKIGLTGISMGAATVLMAAGLDLPDNVRCIAADCPYTSPQAIIRKVCKEDMHIPPTLAWPFLWLGAFLFGHFRLQGPDASETVKQSKVPILLIHGDADLFVPYAMGCQIAAANPDRIEFHTFPGAGHGLSFLVDEARYREIVKAFHQKYLQ